MTEAASNRAGATATRRAANLARLLRPRSIAFVGGARLAAPIASCEEIGFEAEIWVVNRSGKAIAGRQSYRSLAELPGPPDAVFLAVPAADTPATLAELDAMGAGGVVCYAAGFSEIGARGQVLQGELLAAAGDLAVLGPNCYGLLNYLEGAALWADVHGGQRVEEGVAILAQSGNVALNMTMAERAVPLAQVISVGNQAVLELADFIEPLLDDPRIKAIGLFLEGLGDVFAFSRAAEAALVKGVPIVVLKVGRSTVGARIARSHTASLAGEDRLYDALFERLGIVRAPCLTAFLESLKVFALHGPLAGPRLGVLTCSGGDAELVADAAEANGLEIPALGEAQRKALAAHLDEFVTIANPLDYNTAIWGQHGPLSACFTILMSDALDAGVLAIDFAKESSPNLQSWYTAVEALADAHQATGKPAVVLASFAELLPAKARALAVERGLVPLQGIEDGIFALGAAHWYHQAVAEKHAAASAGQLALPEMPSIRTDHEGEQLDEWESKQRLQDFGLACPAGRLVSAPEAGAAAAELGFPVALKAVSDGLAHKSEAGAVALGLAGVAEVEQAVMRMAGLSDRFLVERMVDGAVAELIVGVKRDPQFGLALVLGGGGVLVELAADTATLLLPTDRASIEAILKGLKVDRLLAGFRGRPAGDRKAAVEAVLAVARYALAEGERLVELDVNPLMVRAEGEGAVAADALIRLAKV